ncbi:MAG: methyltransferase domain-containing protein [Chloroflexota bacterium]
MDYQQIYRTQAALYDELVAREDYQGLILPALQSIRPLTGLDVVELGAGTGRLTRLLLPFVRSILACDISPPMLRVAVHNQPAFIRDHPRYPRSIFLAADNRRLPVASHTADLTLAGWSLGHFCGWYPDTWHIEIGQAIGEMKRVLRPGGTAIVIETLGTGYETPHPPRPYLADYYTWLEQEHGFRGDWIRTDYRFASVEEAERLTHFFFGGELAGRVKREKRIVLPECTGVWVWAA